MPSTPSRLVGGLLIPNVATVVGTVPAGHRWLIRDVSIVNSNAAAAQQVTLYIGGNALSDRVYRASIPADTGVLLAPWWSMAAGDTIWALRSVAGNVSLVCFGYDLT